MDKTTTYELMALACSLLFALYIWPPAALLVLAVAFGLLAWIESGATIGRRQ